MASIAEVIRDRVNGDLSLPEETNSRKWLRFPCPFCGKDRAAINYALNLFVCYHADCKVKISARHRSADPAGWLPERFRLQVEQAVRNQKVRLAVNNLERDDLEQYAYQSLSEYDQSGQLDQWEADVGGDPDQLDRYVMQALNGDLANWIAKAIRSRKGENALIDEWIEETRESGRTKTSGDGATADNISTGFPKTEIKARGESTEDSVMWIDWPTLEMRFKYFFTIKEIAKLRKVSVSTTNRRYAEEIADAEKTYREQGYGKD